MAVHKEVSSSLWEIARSCHCYVHVREGRLRQADHSNSCELLRAPPLPDEAACAETGCFIRQEYVPRAAWAQLAGGRRHRESGGGCLPELCDRGDL